MTTLRELFNHFSEVDPAVLDYHLAILDEDAGAAGELAYLIEWNEAVPSQSMLVFEQSPEFAIYEPETDDDDDEWKCAGCPFTTSSLLDFEIHDKENHS